MTWLSHQEFHNLELNNTLEHFSDYIWQLKNIHRSHHPYMYSKITPENMPGTKQEQRTRQRREAANKDCKNKQAEHPGDQGYLSLVNTKVISISNHLLPLKPILKTWYMF